MTARFADLSGWNTPPQAVSWGQYKAWSENGSALSLVALKASEGAGIVDPHYHGYLQGARAAGITSILHYHFARPDISGNTPAREAAFAARAIGGAIGAHDLIILDYEVSAPQATAAWALAWLEAIAAHYGRLPGIYASSAYITARLQESALGTYPLWLAAWNNNPNVRPPAPFPWKSYAYWQFTDRYNTPGVGSTDANIALLEEGGIPLVTTSTAPTTLSLAQALNYFTEEAPDVWYCKIIDPKNPKHYAFHVSHGILAFYRALDPTHAQGHYAGLSILGLPVSAEAYLPGKQDVAYQRFERGVVVFDPRRQMDNPTGTVGDCYLAHIDPLFDAQAQVISLTNINKQLSSDADALKAQNGQLETQNSALQSQLTAASAQLQAAQSANATLQANYAQLASEKAALEQQPDTATYQAFVRDVSGASAQLQAALARVSAPVPSSSPSTGGSNG
jgi:GH25 family lysozyme M1 (1,4-beta-N-acetylmuramidase)